MGIEQLFGQAAGRATPALPPGRAFGQRHALIPANCTHPGCALLNRSKHPPEGGRDPSRFEVATIPIAEAI